MKKPRDVEKLRKSLRKQYNKFAEEFTDWSVKFKELVEEADLMLGALQKILDFKEQE